MEERKPKNIVILAAGDFPSHPIPLKTLQEADFVVCCDSAFETIRNEKLGIRNYVVIGDGDSLSETDKAALGDRWIHVSEQDYNDLHKAMLWATSKFKIQNSKFSILGATGKREDHTLGNISYLITFAEEYPGINLEMLTDHGRFCALSSHLSPFIFHLPSFPRQQVSLFTPDPASSITSDGLRWPLRDFHARLWWQATLNEALADSFTLSITDPVILFQSYDPKG